MVKEFGFCFVVSFFIGLVFSIRMYLLRGSVLMW